MKNLTPLPTKSTQRRRHRPPKMGAWLCDQEQLIATLHRHWPFLKTVLKEQYVVLTDEDLDFREGQEDEFLTRLERKTCRPRREFEEIILAEENHFA